MSEIDVVCCDLCGAIIDGEYRHITVETSNENASIDPGDIEIVERLNTIGYATNVGDLQLTADERIAIDVCGACLNDGAAEAYDYFVETLRGMQHD